MNGERRLEEVNGNRQEYRVSRQRKQLQESPQEYKIKRSKIEKSHGNLD